MLLCLKCWAEDLYVSEAGAGLKDGSSYANRWDTFAHVVWGIGSKKVGPGDTLYVCGTMTGPLDVSYSGTSSNRITIRGDYVGDPGIVDGGSAVQGNIYGLGPDYITIKNITIINAPAVSIKFAAGSTGCVVDNVLAYTADSGAILFQDCFDMVVKNCIFHDICQGGAGHTEGIRYETTEGGEIYNNLLYNVDQIGIDLLTNTTGISVYNNIVRDLTTANSSSGIYCDNAQDNLIYGNLIYNCSRACGIESGSETDGTWSSGNVWLNNIVYDCKGGLGAGNSHGTGNQRLTGDFFYNNTVIDAGTYNNLLINDGTRNLTVKNNIFYTSSASTTVTLHAGGESGLVMDYNCHYRYDNSDEILNYGISKTFTETQALGYELNGMNKNPSLGINYRPTKSSPCIDSGITLPEVTDDFDGNPRPMGHSTDIGAYEYFNTRI